MSEVWNVGPRLYIKLRTEEPRSFGGDGMLSPFGIPVRVSDVFPFTNTCSACGGTGEGVDSTYCWKCHGGGKVTVEGVISGRHGATIIAAYHPRLFEPAFPFALPRSPLARSHSL